MPEAPVSNPLEDRLFSTSLAVNGPGRIPTAPVRENLNFKVNKANVEDIFPRLRQFEAQFPEVTQVGFS